MHFMVLTGFVEILEEILKALFDLSLGKVLLQVAVDGIAIVLSYITESICLWKMYLLASFLSVLESLQNMVDIFSGVVNVSVRLPDGGTKAEPMLMALFDISSITKGFMALTLAAALITFMTTMYRTGRSITDSVVGEHHPISVVLKNAFKAVVALVMIPFMCMCILQMGTVVIRVVNNALYVDDPLTTDPCTIADIIFYTAGEDAIYYPSNVTTEQSKAKYRQAIYASYVTHKVDKKKYTEVDVVATNFKLTEYKFLLGFIVSAAMIIILFGLILTFIRRMLDLLVLYIAAPFFASTIPLDDGQMFTKWRKLFVGKFFSGFGSIIAMKIYLMFMIYVGTDRIQLDESDLVNSILKLFLIIGGAWAVYQGQSMLLLIINEEAGYAEGEASGAMIGLGMLAGGKLKDRTEKAFGGDQGGSSKAGGSKGPTGGGSAARSNQQREHAQPKQQGK